MKKILLLTILLTQQVFAADTYVHGNMTSITSITEGLLIRLEEGNLPTVCTGTPYGWMLIPQSSKVILAVTLAQWYQKKRNVVVYVEPYSGNGFCRVSQVQPG
ncbi:ABC transporter ATP-binding protein [Acinetobacter bereziniae]|uniref:ABC transporter ATP-binding protein n=1 Tax=Acinetobacter bereziniae TaxID=106648 RepID=UPI00125097FC|nr:ABC transporter ATP-binding protein [Acinetobacter bereziniae]